MLLFRAAFFASVLLAPSVAMASPTCPNDNQRSRFHAFADKLERTSSAEDAHRMALSKIRLSRKAFQQASRLVPPTEQLAAAEAKLDALEEGVLGASTPSQVAAQFHQLHARAVNCDYDTVEIIVIVIGFVLGILPGILFLFLFC